MKTKLLIPIVLIVVLAIFGLTKLTKNSSTGTDTDSSVNPTEEPKQADEDVIRSFMDKPDLELSYVAIDLPLPYFRVGKVTKVGNGENMEKVPGWLRQVNIYDQKDLINGTCNVYQYHIDARNTTLTAVIIRGLKSSEVESLKASGVTCNTSNKVQKISKSEAQEIAMSYLERVIPRFNYIKDQFVYSQQRDGHEWLWEDKDYKLPEGLSSRPYPGPVIRIAIYDKDQFQYWNTTSLFEE